ncbi:hypothetical protein ABIA00_003343 [Bradyrhizobium ottawaense]
MLYAWIGDEKRAPRAKGERTICRDCGGLLSAVMPVENVPHWRHKAGDRAGPGCLDSAPLDLSGFLPGYAERGASSATVMRPSP